LPKPYQIRNSNAASLAAQVIRAGGQVVYATQAGDSEKALRSAITQGLESDLLLLSGGVSAGKYDLVENVLAEYDAEFFFTRVLIQPGQPAVFGRAKNKYFFGLPGNPVSTMVTFELFARLAIELLSGEAEPAIRFSNAALTAPFRHKTGLTRFLPALLSTDGMSVTPVPWQGSGDVFAVARANAFLVADEERESWDVGDSIRVLPR
jgi:molybdopterin molybdotransferase